jgi:transposase
MLANGQTVIAVAEQQGVKPEAIRERRRKWWRNGLNSLPDQPRSGALSKLTDSHRCQLKEWIDAGPLNCRALVSRLTTKYGVTISASTLRNELKRLGYVWKRTRYSFKKSAIQSASSRPDKTSPS